MNKQQNFTFNMSTQGKSLLVAYLLWWFVGYLGVHRFYIRRPVSGFCQLALLILGIITALFAVGYLLLMVLGIWWLIDAFLIYGIVEEENRKAGLESASFTIGKTGDTELNKLQQLEKLHELYHKGVITQQEYEEKRRQLL